MKGIPLSRGLDALVSDEDYPELSQYKWSASEVSPGKTYAMRKDGKRTVYMHRVIAGAQKGQPVDHADGNTLNNQRHNLRTCTPTQNQCNRKGPTVRNKSGYLGVCWYPRHGKWMASIGYQKRNYTIGYFDSAEQAARARDEKARELHQDYAYLNFPEPESKGV